MESKFVIPTLIFSVASIIIVFIISVFANKTFEAMLLFREKELMVTAVDQCAKIAVAKWIDPKDNSEITEPFKPTYEKCLKDKGFNVSAKNSE